MSSSRAKSAGEIRGQYDTAHRRSAADPQTRKKIASLRRYWKKLDAIERGDQLRFLISKGCSERGLAKDLQQSATSIRKHVELANLPEGHREAVRSGRSAKKILIQIAKEDRERKASARIEHDASTGELSNKLADLILEICLLWGTPPRRIFPEGQFHQLLQETWKYLSRQSGERIIAPKRRKFRSLKDRMKQCKPHNQGLHWLDHKARWLTTLIMTEVSERPIQLRALERAQAREQELKVEKPPFSELRDRQARMADISRGPEPRKIYPGGARMLGRRGLKT